MNSIQILYSSVWFCAAGVLWHVAWHILVRCSWDCDLNGFRCVEMGISVFTLALHFISTNATATTSCIVRNSQGSAVSFLFVRDFRAAERSRVINWCLVVCVALFVFNCFAMPCWMGRRSSDYFLRLFYRETSAKPQCICTQAIISVRVNCHAAFHMRESVCWRHNLFVVCPLSLRGCFYTQLTKWYCTI